MFAPCGLSSLVLQFDWIILTNGSGLRSLTASSVPVRRGKNSFDAWYSTALDIEEVLAGVMDTEVHLVVVDAVKSFDTVDRGMSDRVLSGRVAWLFQAYLCSASCSGPYWVQAFCWAW